MVAETKKSMRSVSLWSAFHDKLPERNWNKIGTDLRGIVLKSQLYGHANDLCIFIDDETIMSRTGAQALLAAVRKSDPLSVVTDIYRDLTELLNLRREPAELFRNYELRFAAQASTFNANGPSVALPSSLTALALLANSGVDSPQRISILAAAAPSSSSLNESSPKEDFISLVNYESIASVLRKCDKPKSETAPDLKPLYSNQTSTPHYEQRHTRPKSRLAPEDLVNLKLRCRCPHCNIFGH